MADAKTIKSSTYVAVRPQGLCVSPLRGYSSDGKVKIFTFVVIESFGVVFSLQRQMDLARISSIGYGLGYVHQIASK